MPKIGDASRVQIAACNEMECDSLLATVITTMAAMYQDRYDFDEYGDPSKKKLPVEVINLRDRASWGWGPPQGSKRRRRFRRLKLKIENEGGIKVRVYELYPRFRELNYYSGNL